MKKTKIAAVCVFMGVIAALCMTAMLYFSGKYVAYHFGMAIDPGVKSIINLAKFSTGAVKSVSLLLLITSFAGPAVIFAAITYVVCKPKKRELHGSARFANEAELLESGLLQPDSPSDKYPSILVGKVGKLFLKFRGQQFMFLAAPTRSGKGVGIVIPNLLHYRDSAVVLDLKDENFQKTAGFRAKCGQKVFRFAPDDENFITDCWNPLHYVRQDPRFKIADLMSVTNILYPPSDDVWNATAESLFLGLALYVMETSKEADKFNIASIKKLRVNLPFLKDEETFNKYVKEREPFEPLSEDCITHLRSYSQTSDKLRNSIAISFDKPLGIFSDPITARATRKNTFDFRQLRRVRMTVYVSIKPANIDKFGQLLNLFFQQMLVLNMDKLPEEDPTLKYQCLILLDEFPAMGRVAIIEKASAYMAGYNMRLLLIFQSKSQVKDRKLYDETGAQTMLTNMALQVVYAPRDDADAKDYSEMIGYMTEKGISRSRQLSGKGGRGENESDQRRAVLLPQEVKEIGKDKSIVSMENMRPALVEKIFWYKEPGFVSRANLPVPIIPDQSVMSNTISQGPENEIQSYMGAPDTSSIDNGAQFEIGFSPNRNALEVVMSFVLMAKDELLIAAYSFTSKDIAFAIADAKNRGVNVRVVVDNKQNSDDQGGYNAIDYLIKQGIEVIRNDNYAAMHHKFMVADKTHVQLGSFNYTASAATRNAETAIVLRDAPTIAINYRNEWLRLSSEPKSSIEAIQRVNKGLAILKEFGI